MDNCILSDYYILYFQCIWNLTMQWDEISEV